MKHDGQKYNYLYISLKEIKNTVSDSSTVTENDLEERDRIFFNRQRSKTSR
jgi:hypothetical protein